MRIDLNTDVGEGYDDEPLYAIVSSVNIACGAHAGDDESMSRAVGAALRHGVTVGAHPGYADRETMGRRALSLLPDELVRTLLEQIHRLGGFASEHRTGILHVKPHGALYNQAATDRALADVIADTVRRIHPALRLVGLAGSALVDAARARGIPFAEEAFADRRYLADGTLVPRDAEGAVIEDPEEAARQALAIARGEPVETADGPAIIVQADTICCHGDTPGAVEIARAVRRALERNGFDIAPPS